MSHAYKLLECEGVYTYSFFGGSKHRDLCAFVLSHDNLYTHVAASMRGYTSGDVTAAIAHLRGRVPVYFGRARTDLYRAASPLVAATTNVEPEAARYVLCGKVLAGSDDGTGPRWLHVIHAWGVNLETRLTEDYREFISEGRITRPTYQTAVRTTVELIFEAALRSGAIDLVLPMIGLGAFLGAVSAPSDRNWALRIFVSEVQKAASIDRSSRLRVWLCDYEAKIPPGLCTGSSGEEPSVRILQGRDGDMFALAARLLSASKSLAVVNAWDSRSWIGNGGSRDPTIDGMLVAGYGPGRPFPNSSYLHNTQLIPALLDPRAWRTVCC